MKDKRFNIHKSEGSVWSLKTQILVDEVTGVNYLLISGGYGLAITPLLDSEGKPVISRSIVGKEMI